MSSTFQFSTPSPYAFAMPSTTSACDLTLCESVHRYQQMASVSKPLQLCLFSCTLLAALTAGMCHPVHLPPQPRQAPHLLTLACMQVRMAYLSNERLVWLQQQVPSAVPPNLLLQGPALRAGQCPGAASQQLLQQPAVWSPRRAGAC